MEGVAKNLQEETKKAAESLSPFQAVTGGCAHMLTFLQRFYTNHCRALPSNFVDVPRARWATYSLKYYAHLTRVSNRKNIPVPDLPSRDVASGRGP